MGIMTLGEFRTDVAEGLQRGSADAIGVPRVDRWIYNAMVEFAYALKMRELEADEEQIILAGTNELVFPADFRFMHDNGVELFGTERFEGRLIPETRAQYLQRLRTVGGFNRTGAPRFYHVYGPRFLVRPVTDANYNVLVHYWKKLPLLVDDDDVSIFGEDWDDIILTGALYRGFRHFNEFDRYQNVRNDFLGLIRSRKMAEDLEEFPEGGISAVHYRETEDILTYGRRDIGDEDQGESLQ